MSIRNFLLKIGFLDLTVERMQSFVNESNRSMINWSFTNGRYNVRKLGVEYFIEKNESDSILMLQKAIHDEVEVISQAAMVGLEELTSSPEIHEEIAQKRQFWMIENEYREERRNREHRKTSVLTESKERGSKKSLDNARNMLKKPMIGGKWF